MQIPGRISIDERPLIVGKKIRIRDWEIDTIIGKNHKGALLTIVERKSMLLLVKKLQKKKADYVLDAAVSILSPIQGNVHTITADNGKEFSSHEMISKELSTQGYFAHPCHSWERGLCKIRMALSISTFQSQQILRLSLTTKVLWLWIASITDRENLFASLPLMRYSMPQS